MIFLSLVTSLFATIGLIPGLIRISRILKIEDTPGKRKIHTSITPRCGGIAIFLAAIIPTSMWVSLDRSLFSLVIGALIVFAFGVWDDRSALNFKWKLFGQSIGVIIVLLGNVIMYRFPFIDSNFLPLFITVPITAMFLLGITNAINLTDGLDGLAAGCALLSLGIIFIISYQASDRGGAMLAVIFMGGIIGFLRYNTYPAVIFLGDAGSQLLGFLVGGLSIYIINNADVAVSPSLPLLFLLLPILDTVWIVIHRLYNGKPVYLGDNNHIHHKLLKLGFRHQEAVALVYSVHGILTLVAYLLRYKSDILILVIFFFTCGLILGLFFCASVLRWNLQSSHRARSFLKELRRLIPRNELIVSLLLKFITYEILCLLICSSLVFGKVSSDLATLSFCVGTLMILSGVIPRFKLEFISNAGIYVAVVLDVFLVFDSEQGLIFKNIILTLMAILAIATALLVKSVRGNVFEITTKDLLIAFFALIIPNLQYDVLIVMPIGTLVFTLVVLFYSSEFIVASGRIDNAGKNCYHILRITAIIVFIIIVIRGVAGIGISL